MKARIIREPRCALLWRIDETYPNYAAITRAAKRYDVKLRAVADGDLGGIVGDLCAGKPAPAFAPLITAPDRLVQIRRNRLLSLNQGTETDYVDMDAVQRELKFAGRMFADNDWPVIDVSRRSIEETAAAIMRLLAERDSSHDAHEPGPKPI